MIIFPEDWRVTALIGAVAVILMLVCSWLIEETKPFCPAGSEAKHTRGGWFCVVPEAK